MNEGEQRQAIERDIERIFMCITSILYIGIAWRYFTYIFDTYPDQTYVMAAFVIIGVKGLDLGFHFNTIFNTVSNYVHLLGNKTEESE